MSRVAICAHIACEYFWGVFWSAVGILVVGNIFYWAGVALPDEPTISIENLYIPALNITSNQTHNTTLFFDLKLNNLDDENDIHYETIHVTLFYGQNHSFPLANVSFPGFHQGVSKNAHRKEAVEAVGLPWDTAIVDVMNGTTTIQVNVNTTVKYTHQLRKSKRQEIMVGNNLTVNNKGSLVKKHNKGVKLVWL